MSLANGAALGGAAAVSAPERRPRVLITGGTGFIGSHFLLALHERRRSAVWALVRASDEVAATSKLKEALRICAESYRAFRDHVDAAGSTRVFLGDVSLPGCAVAPDMIEELAADGGIDEFWHFAASLNFEEKHRDFLTAHNIEGTRHAVELANRVGARRFVYVSTAYTSGKRTGLIPETLHDPAGPFNNCYEESKCAAEHLVTKLCAEAGIQLLILRPSVVIGPSETKQPGGSRSGVYGFIREMSRLAAAIQNWSGALRISAEPDIPLNVIPVDCFVQDVLHVVDANFDVPPILHVTATSSPSVATCVTTVAAGLGLDTVEVYQGPKETFSPLEQLVDQRIVFYGGYLTGAKEFARSLPSQWSVSAQDYLAFVAEGIRERRRTSVNSVFDRGLLKSFDGSPLSSYVCGNESGPAVILSNAVGMPAAFWAPLAARLAKHYRVLTWETRGVPSFTDNFAERECDVDTHIQDMLALMDAHGIATAHVMGWCTGALVALKSAYAASDRIRSAVLLNGSYSLGPEHPRCPFERNMRLVMPKIAASRRTAEMYYRTIYLPKRTGALTPQGDEAQVQITELLMSADPDLIHLTSVPYDSVDSLHRYGRLISETLKENVVSWIGEVRCPAFVVSGTADVTEHPEGSRFIASQLARAKLEIYPGMDHFGLFNSSRLADDIVEFLDAQHVTAPLAPASLSLEA